MFGPRNFRKPRAFPAAAAAVRRSRAYKMFAPGEQTCDRSFDGGGSIYRNRATVGRQLRPQVERWAAHLHTLSSFGTRAGGR